MTSVTIWLVIYVTLDFKELRDPFTAFNSAENFESIEKATALDISDIGNKMFVTVNKFINTQDGN